MGFCKAHAIRGAGAIPQPFQQVGRELAWRLQGEPGLLSTALAQCTNVDAPPRCTPPALAARLIRCIYSYPRPCSLITVPTSTSSACACSRLRRATRALTQLYDDALAPSGLRVTQFALLRTLSRQQTMTISALAAKMLLDRTALSRNLDPLAERGLVEVVPGSDLRTRYVTMTAAGKRALDAAEPHWTDAQREVSRRIGKQRLAELYGLLEDVERLHPVLSDTKGST